MKAIANFKKISLRRVAIYAGATTGTALTALLLFVGYQISPSKLDVAHYADLSLDYRLPVNPARPDVELNLVLTGHHDGPEALIFRGGSLLKTHRAVFSG